MRRLTRIRLEREAAQRANLYAYRMTEARTVLEYKRSERVERLRGLPEISRGATDLAWTVMMNEWRRTNE